MKYDCACGETCGPDFALTRKCGCGGGQCGAACGAGCTDRCCGEQPCCRTLLDELFGCNGCGELYWNEWYNDPPACCEPCDCLGNYAGGHAAGSYYRPHLGPVGYAKSKSGTPTQQVAKRKGKATANAVR
jgi:hypothetical protein